MLTALVHGPLHKEGIRQQQQTNDKGEGQAAPRAQRHRRIEASETARQRMLLSAGATSLCATAAATSHHSIKPSHRTLPPHPLPYPTPALLAPSHSLSCWNAMGCFALRCCTRWQRRAKSCMQRSQRNGFSPLCTRSCLFKFPRSAKLSPHPL